MPGPPPGGPGRPRLLAVALVERAGDHAGRRPHLLVQALEQEGALLRVRDAAQQQHPQRGEAQDRGDEAGPERGHHVRGDRSA